jgi:hypothetical protein
MGYLKAFMMTNRPKGVESPIQEWIQLLPANLFIVRTLHKPHILLKNSHQVLSQTLTILSCLKMRSFNLVCVSPPPKACHKVQ